MIESKDDFDFTEEAIQALCPKAVFQIYQKPGEGIEKIWLDMKGDTVPSDDNIALKLTEIKKAWNDKLYQRERVYPNIGDQLDMIYWDQVNNTTKFKEAVAKVKADKPKP